MLSIKYEKMIFPTIVIVSITLFTSVVFVVGLSIASIIDGHQILLDAALFLSFVIPFVVLPSILFRKLINLDDIISLDKRKLFIDIGIFVVAFTILTFFIDDYRTLAIGVVIAFSEEYLFRNLIFKYLKRELGLLMAIIINSIVFAFLLHMNADLLMNLIVRLPLGIGLSLLKHYFGLGKAVLAHWLYNAIVTFI